MGEYHEKGYRVRFRGHGCDAAIIVPLSYGAQVGRLEPKGLPPRSAKALIVLKHASHSKGGPASVGRSGPALAGLESR